MTHGKWHVLCVVFGLVLIAYLLWMLNAGRPFEPMLPEDFAIVLIVLALSHVCHRKVVRTKPIGIPVERRIHKRLGQRTFD